ncbi:protein DBF4 homolog B [Neopelma chrysocephalum]|uniref:protein DBF4 homolog B n=1 Tax=Neopelma chrysocephalum TaxID=114329 RepID=UPI000FCD3E70|nr:protein DBF4 homolog B [Neopelma chrysocephalum]
MAGPAPGAARPLRGQSFYLDLPGGRSARHLAEAIERLGGVTESFLSKEVTYVVSSNKEAKRDRARTGDGKQSNPTSGDTKPTSSGPAASRGNPPRPHQKPPDTALLSRGKELLQKAMKNQDTCSGSSILANARLWGVQILHVDEMLSYAQQLLGAISGVRKRCQKTEGKCLASGSKIHKGGRLKPPFLKVEDQSRQFRPFHHQFQSFPDLNFLAPKSSSPFEPLKSLSNSCQARGAGGCALRSDGGKSPRSTPVPRRRRGFCECCQDTFEELHKHLQSPQHQRFARDDSQYIPVDRVISQLTNSFLQCSDRVPQSCLADEHLVSQAHGTGGVEMLTELGKGREQPEQGAVELVMDMERDHDLKIKGCSPCLPGDRVRDPREGGGLSEHSSVGLPRGAELRGRVCAAPGTTEGAGLGVAGLGSAPAPGWGSCAAAAPVTQAVAPASEPRGQQVPGSVSHPPEALPVPRKRQLSPSQSSQVGKRPRLEQGEQTDPVRGGLGAQGAGQMSEPGLPGVTEAGRLSLHTQLCSRPRGSLALDPCLGRSPGDPGSLGAVDPAGAAPASTISEHGWSGASVRSQGQQLQGDGATPGNGSSLDLESTGSSGSSCPAGRPPSPTPPGAGARCCCSVRVRAAEKAAPEAPELPGHSTERAPCPGLLPPPAQSTQNTRAALCAGRSSSESERDVQLLPLPAGVQGSRIPAVDRDVLQRTHGRGRDSGFESQLCSVLQRDLEPGWAGQESGNCRTCCTDTRGAPFPVFETFCGSWTS